MTKRTCPECGKAKDLYDTPCRACQPKPKGWEGYKGARHPAWKGGEHLDRDGYRRLYRPDYQWARGSGYVLEHVMVMEQHLGRRLNPKVETVHHLDGDRLNNVLDNLELKRRGEHSRQHRLLDTHRRKRISGRFAGKEVPRAGD